MPDNDWSVGEKATNGVRLFEAGVEVTAGTATIRYVLNDAGTTKWLQDDETTVNTTPNTIDITHVANEGFVHDLTIPEAMRGKTGTFFVTDPATGADIYSETFEVSSGTGTGGGSSLSVKLV